MTTETQERQQIDAAEVWRAIGRLEGEMKSVKDSVDRLFYLILGIGAATIASVWANNLFGG